jgi:LacI family gluconate utilization system Gnt-I transcriptional repressor
MASLPSGAGSKRAGHMADDSPDKLSQNVGLKEIAQRSGVGVITVSRAINHPETVAEKTRQRIYQAIDELGFIPNQVAGNLARSRARIIGTVVPPLINSGIAEQVQGMSDVLREKGFQLLISQGEFTLEIEESLIRSLLGWRPAGFILQAYVQSERRARTFSRATCRRSRSARSRAALQSAPLSAYRISPPRGR